MFEIAKQQLERKVQIMLTRKRFPANNSHTPSSCQWDPIYIHSFPSISRKTKYFRQRKIFISFPSISDKEKDFTLSQSISDKAKYITLFQVFLAKKNILHYPKYF